MFFIFHVLLTISVVSEEILTDDRSGSPAVNCTIFKDEFGSSVSSFMSCATHNSRPITFCEKCVDNYIAVTDSFSNMTLNNDENGLPCINNYINLDRLQIVQTLYGNVIDIWNRAKCYECFTFENGSLTRNLSQETITFNKLLTDLKQCINRSDVNITTMCAKCLDTYLIMSSYYDSISNENEKIGVCMDIVDLMNGTRGFWSKSCCKFRKHTEYVFIGSTIAVILMTLIFYVLAKVCTVKKLPVVFKQSRFAGSFAQLSQHSRR